MTGQVRVRVTPFTAWILDTTKESGLEVLVGGWEPFDLWVCVSAQPVISRRFPLHDGRETGGRGTRACHRNWQSVRFPIAEAKGTV